MVVGYVEGLYVGNTSRIQAKCAPPIKLHSFNPDILIEDLISQVTAQDITCARGQGRPYGDAFFYLFNGRSGYVCLRGQLGDC